MQCARSLDAANLLLSNALCLTLFRNIELAGISDTDNSIGGNICLYIALPIQAAATASG